MTTTTSRHSSPAAAAALSVVSLCHLHHDVVHLLVVVTAAFLAVMPSPSVVASFVHVAHNVNHHNSYYDTNNKQQQHHQRRWRLNLHRRTDQQEDPFNSNNKSGKKHSLTALASSRRPTWTSSSSTSLLHAAAADDATDAAASSRDIRLTQLQDLLAQAPKNGIDTPPELVQQIVDVCTQLEQVNPNPKPCQRPASIESLLNGFWYLQWTNYGPPGPSSGKLGPFVGNVYQDLKLTAADNDNDNNNNNNNTTALFARNIFRVDLFNNRNLNIMGELLATPHIHDDTTVAITFVKVASKVAGWLPFGPQIEFEPNKEVRLWEHIYVDEQYRIFYARNANATASTAENDRGYLYVVERQDEERFSTNIFV